MPWENVGAPERVFLLCPPHSAPLSPRSARRMSVDETPNLIRPKAWIVAVSIPLEAIATSPINVDEESLATVEAIRQMQIHVIDLVIEEDRRFAHQIADSSLVTVDADSRERMTQVATHVDMPVPSNIVACEHLTIEAMHYRRPRL